MQKKMLIALLVLAVTGGATFVFFSKNTKNSEDKEKDFVSSIIPKDRVWNAYTVKNKIFIYPAEWTFKEIKGEKNGNVQGFSAIYPAGQNTEDKITIGGGSCFNPVEGAIECFDDIPIYTYSTDPEVLGVYESMRLFAENSTQ